jgi:Arc/MetJ family transcription regulator
VWSKSVVQATVNTCLPVRRIYATRVIYTDLVVKHLVDIDEQALRAAKLKLGTGTIKDTVNGALRQAGDDHGSSLAERLDALAAAELAPREQAWR